MRKPLLAFFLLLSVLPVPPVTAADGQIASVACSQWRWGIGDDPIGYDGWEDSHDDFTDTSAQSGGDILRWLSPTSSYWQSVEATTTGDEVAVVWMLCIRQDDVITTDQLTTVHDLIRDRWPTQPLYVIPLDVKRPDPCNEGEYEQSVEHRDWVLDTFPNTLPGPELMPTLSADEVHVACHPNQAGIDRYSAMLAEWVPAMLAGTTPEGSGRFTDDDGNTHEGYIEAIAEAGITLGCNPPDNDRFCPDDFVSRAQMASFLDRARDLPATAIDAFLDDNGSTHEAAINRVAAAGITVGCDAADPSRYCPSANVTRGQMATFLDRAFELAATAVDFFTDDDGSPHEAAINRVAAAGITLGCDTADPARFCPTDPVSRAQMASFLGRALGLDEILP